MQQFFSSSHREALGFTTDAERVPIYSAAIVEHADDHATIGPARTEHDMTGFGLAGGNPHRRSFDAVVQRITYRVRQDRPDRHPTAAIEPETIVLNLDVRFLAQALRKLPCLMREVIETSLDRLER